MGFDLVLKNAKIPQGNRTVDTHILVKDGKIAGFTNDLTGIEVAEVIDAENNLVLPGCIDSHTHFNDPGFTHRENFATGTQAAAAGGVTTIIDMPCCSIPSVRSVDNLEAKLEVIKDKAYVDYAMWGGATGEDVRNNALYNIKEQADYGVVAFKVYMTPSVPTYPPASDAEMLEIFREVAKTGLPVGIHAENLDLCTYHVNKLRNEGRFDGPAWAEARLELAEKVAIQMAISFAEETGARLHIVHMSTGIGGVLVGEAKKRGLDVTAETCPHYLVLNAYESMTKWRQFAKIAPPLRTTRDNEMLWEQLADGRVDFIATDHAPYEIATEKEAEGMDIWTAFPGIPGVETMVPIIISEGYNKGRLSLSRLVDVLSRNAAIHYGLYPKKGALEIGSDADFTVIDLDYEWTIDKDKMYTMAKYTPFHGMKLKGKPVKTIVRGKLVYDDKNGIVGKPGYGQFVKRQTISKLERWIKF
ncbi:MULTISPECIES: allantoinase AllB [Carboxydothermus]|uniref:allantoinase n=2 Tax=Carboxydothermus TaxID=129957 RepID=Q3AEA1_CARHZ|nr:MULTISPECIES: allantoinase AllB [Carboxydothermus]ABB14968.1 allantoinase [Carboxydothermus hydrogenoformans Z-2901]NYE56545.1 dihydropyrimidinase/allantoinase [Carboxydothermus ferrireducens DSM 11255]